jgi:hypothetical protein
VTGFTGAVIPQWWGAKGDGTTDDTSAINKALAAATTVYLPVTASSYVIDGNNPIALRSGSTLYSHGATLKLKAGTYASTAEVIATAPGQNGSYDANVAVVSDVTISGIKIDGNMANVSGSATGIDLYKVLRARVSDVNIMGLPGITGGGYGIIAEYSNTIHISRVFIDRTDRQNIAIWETQDAHIDQSTLNDSHLRDCVLVSSNTPASYQTSHATITNSKFTNTSATGTHVIRFSGGGSGIVTNNEIASNDNLEGIYITDTVAQKVHIAHNKITNCLYGVKVESDNVDKYVSIDDNDISSCVNGISYNTKGTVRVTNNRIIDTTTQPLLLAFAADKAATGNLIDGGNTTISIRSETGGTTVFSDNVVRDMTSATRSVFMIGDAGTTPMVANNVLTGNTANVITGTTKGYFVNNAATVDAFSAYVINTAYRTLYNASVPTSGTWEVNDRTIRTPATVGQSKAWVCTVSGTAGTLNGGATTANTTATSDVIAVSSTTGINVGDYITVAGIGGTTKKKVVSISSLNVTVDTAATNTVTGGAVSYVAPTFTSEGNL